MKQIEIQFQSKLFDNYDKHFNPQILNNNIIVELIDKYYQVSRIQIQPDDTHTTYDLVKNSPIKFIYINSNIPIQIFYTLYNATTRVYTDYIITTSLFTFKNSADEISYLNIKQNDNINLYNPNNQTIIIDYLIITR